MIQSDPIPLGDALHPAIEQARQWTLAYQATPEYQKMRARHDQQARDHDARQDHEDLVGMGIPSRSAALLLGDGLDSTTAAMVAARDFIGAPGVDILVLSGGIGSGKTVAAAWAVEARRGYFLDATRLMRYSLYDLSAAQRLDNYTILAIDDLGVEHSDKSGVFQTILDGVINARYSMQRKTVMTTNLRAADFCKRYGDRIADRIREAGQYIEIADKSRRAKPHNTGGDA